MQYSLKKTEKLVMGMMSLCFIFGWVENLYGKTVEVSTAAELVNEVYYSSPGDTVLLEDGLYDLAETGTVVVRTDHLTIRGKTGNRESVIIQGWGMYADGHNGFWVSANDVTIADLTVQNVRYHCIQADVNVDRLIVQNCILRDAGEQILKVPTSTGENYSDSGLVEGCLFEYSACVGPRSYMGGIDVHRGKDWIVRDNVFRYIRSPGGSLSEHAIHFWNDSQGTLVERNLIINCDRGIGFGLGSSTHTGGVIRNNMIAHDGAPLPDGSTGFDDVGIGLESAPGAQVYNNTIFFQHFYNAIEYRFATTTGVTISNNLVNRAIQQRDGASAVLETNVLNAQSTWFEDAASGDLHLAYGIPDVVDQGTTISDLEDDFDRDFRPHGQGMDIGADEFIPCYPDQDGDGDVDGSDLAEFISNFNGDCLAEFSDQYGLYEVVTFD